MTRTAKSCGFKSHYPHQILFYIKRERPFMRIKLWYLRKKFWIKIHDLASKKAFVDYLICPYENSTKQSFNFD